MTSVYLHKCESIRQALEEIDKLPVVMGRTIVIRVEGKEEG